MRLLQRVGVVVMLGMVLVVMMTGGLLKLLVRSWWIFCSRPDWVKWATEDRYDLFHVGSPLPFLELFKCDVFRTPTLKMDAIVKSNQIVIGKFWVL